LRYGYANDEARGYDQVGETKETADNSSDGSYEKDIYRVRVTYRPRSSPYRSPGLGSGTGALLYPIQTLGSWLDHALVKIRTSNLYFQYTYYRQFYTSTKPLHIDPLHVGRMDESRQIEVKWSSKSIWNRIRLEAGWRYTVRTAESPGGLIGEDPSEEKDYTGNRYWLSASRPLW
jgi:hypothetical protein